VIPPERSFAVLVAIDEYARAGNGIKPDLATAVKDATAIAEALVDSCGYARANVSLLTNESATKSSIERAFLDVARALEKLARAEAGAEQKGQTRLWVYFAGHGLPAADEATQDTLFATWDATADQPSRTALASETIERWLPKEADEIVCALDCCHAKGMLGLKLPTEPAKPQRRTLIQTSLNGAFAYERKDRTRGLFAQALLEALEGKAELRRGVLELDAVMAYVIARVPELTLSEYGSDYPLQKPQVSGDLLNWELGRPGEPWPRLPKLLSGFSTVEPPPLDGTPPWRTLVILSDADEKAAQPLRPVVEDALKLAKRGVEPYVTLDTEPLAIRASDAFGSDARLLETLRALCRVPIAVFDVTHFEPAVMLLLGVRSIVRRGVTICSVGDGYKLGGSLEFPFNFREVSFAAHSTEQERPKARELMKERLVAGVREICEFPQYYQDLPGFEASRRPVTPVKRRAKSSRPTIFVLCPFGPRYGERCWGHLEQSLKTAFDAELDDDFEVVRMLETDSPRLLTQTLYEQIRRSPVCVVDLTGFRANVVLELGVRLALSPGGADCVLEEDDVLEPERAYLKPQIERLTARLRPLAYTVAKGSIEAFSELARRSQDTRPVSTWFDTISRWVDPSGEVPRVRPDLELRAVARSYEPEEATRGGSSSLLFPSKSLQEQASLAACERRLCAWLYLDGIFDLDTIRSNKELRDQYSLLGTLILQWTPAAPNGAVVAERASYVERLHAVRERVRERLKLIEGVALKAAPEPAPPSRGP
jgi:hypothetical protein